MGEENGELRSALSLDWNRVLLGIAVIGAGYGSIVGSLERSDPFFGKDGKLLQQQISALAQDVKALRNDVNRIDRNGPSIGNEYLRRTLQEVERRVDGLEKERK